MKTNKKKEARDSISAAAINNNPAVDEFLKSSIGERIAASKILNDESSPTNNKNITGMTPMNDYNHMRRN